MTKHTQKERRETRKKQQHSTNEQSTDDDKHNDKSHEPQYMAEYTFVNLSGREITPDVLAHLKSWSLAQKRTITFNGMASYEITNMTDDIIYFNGGSGCFLSIISTAETSPDLEMPYLFQWVKEKQPLMVLKLNDKNDVVGFAVLHGVKFDPLRKHINPFVMDYIYTYENYRNMGYAKSLINAIKEKYQFTAFCNSELSELVFRKCNLDLMRATMCPINSKMMMARTR
jgi:GNAT superfamily N-acetyltransferase